MLNTFSLQYPLASRIWSNPKSLFLRQICLIAFGNVLLTCASKINIQLMPVPVTMQTLAVLFIGMTYGWRLAGITIFAYLVEGTLGLPVFAWPIGGLAVLLGSNGGYLLGFIPAAMLSGFLVERGFGRSVFSSFIAGILGALTIYVCGALVLAHFIGLAQAILVGVKPFLLIDFIKVLLLAVIVPTFWRSAKT